MSSAELTTESVELGEGMLRLIGAYGMHAALDVRELHQRATPESPPTELGLSSAETDTSEGVRPRATR